jgi:hypothetical protein
MSLSTFDIDIARIQFWRFRAHNSRNILKDNLCALQATDIHSLIIKVVNYRQIKHHDGLWLFTQSCLIRYLRNLKCLGNFLLLFRKRTFQTPYTLHLSSSHILGITWKIFIFLYRMNLAIWPRRIQNFILKALIFYKFWLFWYGIGPPLTSSGQSSWLQVQRSGFDSWSYQIFWEVVDLESGSTQPRESSNPRI